MTFWGHMSHKTTSVNSLFPNIEELVCHKFPHGRKPHVHKESSNFPVEMQLLRQGPHMQLHIDENCINILSVSFRVMF